MTMPVFFLAHGSPMNALEQNYFTNDWLQLHEGCPTPKAIVIFSAHWHVPGTRILSSEQPKTIHDFGGFPPALYQQQYPCPGNPTLAKALKDSLSEAGFEASLDDNWGLDHGSWVILKHIYPEADIPVLQISLDVNRHDLTQHYAMAQALQTYRDQGVLFIGSGNIVHNIGKWMMSSPNDPIDWARDFDAVIADAIAARDIETLCQYSTLPYARDAVPTVEHYLPLIYCMGLTQADEALRFSDFGFEDLSTACSRSARWG